MAFIPTSVVEQIASIKRQSSTFADAPIVFGREQHWIHKINEITEHCDTVNQRDRKESRATSMSCFR